MWIGVECDVNGCELMKWAGHIRDCGGERTAEFLEKSAMAVDRREGNTEEAAEGAAEAVERIRKETREKTEKIIRGTLGKVDVGAVMRSLGISGAMPDGVKGSVTRSKKRKNVPSVKRDKDGNPVIVASQSGRAVKSAILNMLKKDEIYAMMNEARLASELRGAGVRMSDIAHITGLTKGDAWRMAMGYGRYWHRMKKTGKFPPESQSYGEYMKNRIVKSGLRYAALEAVAGKDAWDTRAVQITEHEQTTGQEGK